MVISALLSSCSSGKKVQASTTPSTTIKKESTVTGPKKEEVVTPETKSTEVPPSDLKDNFANRFPLAKNVSWEKSSDLTDASATTAQYKVVFVEDGKTNWIIYSEKGDILEERQQIEIDQLPQNIYNAIKEKYPTYKIALATTYKHTHKEGSYAVVLKPVSPNDTKEISAIFRENASLVE